MKPWTLALNFSCCAAAAPEAVAHRIDEKLLSTGKLMDRALNSALQKRVAATPVALERGFQVNQQAADDEVGHGEFSRVWYAGTVGPMMQSAFGVFPSAIRATPQNPAQSPMPDPDAPATNTATGCWKAWPARWPPKATRTPPLPTSCAKRPCRAGLLRAFRQLRPTA